MQETVDSPWAVLGLDEGATLAEVRRAFRARAKTTHPDHGGCRSEFEALRAAFEAARRVADDRPEVAMEAEGAAPAPAGSPAAPVESPGASAASPAAGLRVPRVTPAPLRVVHAYDWAAGSTTGSPGARRRPRTRSVRASASVGAERPSFASVLHQEMARLGVPA